MKIEFTAGMIDKFYGGELSRHDLLQELADIANKEYEIETFVSDLVYYVNGGEE